MSLVSLLLIVAAVSAPRPKADMWDYPAGGPSSTAQRSLATTGNFRSFATVTKDPPEKVVLWYAKRLGLGDNDGLVKAAEAGFGKLETPLEGHDGVAHDTDAEKWGALIEYSLSADSAHVHILVRPENDAAKDVAISINQSTKGTAISVIASVPPEAAGKPAAVPKP